MKIIRIHHYILIAVILLILMAVTAQGEEPYIGILGIKSDSPRSKAISIVLQRNLQNIIKEQRIFETVNSESLSRQLQKFGCVEEKCFIGFARNADLDVIFNGSLEDKGEHLILTLTSYGIDIPFNGKMISRYRTRIPIRKGYNIQHYGHICREHSAYFMASFLRNFSSPVSVKSIKKSYVKDGEYPVFRGKTDFGTMPVYDRIGAIRVEEKKIIYQDIPTQPNDFIFTRYNVLAQSLVDEAFATKRELIFQRPGGADILYALLVTAPTSATMPITAPIFGYYMNNDWAGLTLWAFNTTPYLYLEIDGFINRPAAYREDRKDIPKHVHTHHRFAYYMLFGGGFSIFVDAVAHQSLNSASNYEGIQPYMGNPYVAAYCSLISGGGGHFYKGYRFWGYLYFHINNILMYMIMREFSPNEEYNAATDSYTKSGVNRTMGYTYIGIYSAVKIIEIIHTIFLRDRIRNGETVEEEFSCAPLITPDLTSGDGRLTYGMMFSFKF